MDSPRLADRAPQDEARAMPSPDDLEPATRSPTAPHDQTHCGPATALERRGRWWLLASFLACPCHLPLTLTVLGTVLGGTALGVAMREHTLAAGLLIAAVWIAGTGRGLLLVRRAERGGLACPR